MSRIATPVLFAGLLAILPMTASSQLGNLVPQDQYVVVDGATDWTASGITVEADDVLIIRAKGTSSGWGTSNDWWEWTGPEGLLEEFGVPSSHPLPGFPGTCLIGRIGINGDPFYVGEFTAIKAPASGELYLGPNDYQTWDNPNQFYGFIWNLGPALAAPLARQASASRVTTAPNQPLQLLAPQDQYTVVDGSVPWTLSGLTVVQGETLIILSKGTSSGWGTSNDWWEWTGPKGLLEEFGVPDTHPLPGYPGTCLIGRIDGGEPFYVGEFTAIAAPASGELQFGPNDYQPGDNPGDFHVFVWREHNQGPSSVNAAVPILEMQQNYPNPFNPTTTITFSLPSQTYVTLSIFDPNGRLVSRLIDEPLDSGRHETAWNGTDLSGQPVSSGAYFYRLRADNKVLTGKMMLLK